MHASIRQHQLSPLTCFMFTRYSSRRVLDAHVLVRERSHGAHWNGCYWYGLPFVCHSLHKEMVFPCSPILRSSETIDKIGKNEAESIFKDNLWPLIQAHPDLFPGQDEAYFLRIFHRMGSLIMAYAFHAEDEADDEDEDDEDEEAEPNVSVSMVPMADMLNHKTGHNNVRLPLSDINRHIALAKRKQRLINSQLEKKIGSLVPREGVSPHGVNQAYQIGPADRKDALHSGKPSSLAFQVLTCFPSLIYSITLMAIFATLVRVWGWVYY